MQASPAIANDSKGPSIRQRATHGILWVGLLSVVTRVIGLLQQFVLAWLLSKSDFGVLGLAYTVIGVVNLLANPGIDAVLVSRRRRFRLWASPALWMGLSTGLAAMLLTIASSPLAARVYDEPRLIAFLVIASFSMPLQTLQIVPRAHLQATLQFRKLTLLGVTANLLTAGLTISCAALGFGALSFAIPLPISAAVVAVTAWSVARPQVRFVAQFRRWKYLLADSIPLASTRALLAVIAQGDYLVMGLAKFPDSAIGTYVLSYNFAVQAYRIMANSVESVLFPSLSHVSSDPLVQTRAMMRATRLLAVSTVPFCMLQILLTQPIFELFFPQHWQDAIVTIQILTLGVMINAPCWPAMSLLTAQRRFGEYFRLTLVYAVTFFIAVGYAAWAHRTINAVAIAFAMWSVWGSAFVYWMTVRPRSPYYRYFSEIYRPVLAGFIAATPGYALLCGISPSIWSNAAAALAIAVSFCAIYAVMLRLLARSDYNDFLLQIKPLVSKLVVARR